MNLFHNSKLTKSTTFCLVWLVVCISSSQAKIKLTTETTLLENGISIKILSTPENNLLRIARYNNPIKKVTLESNNKTVELKLTPKKDFWEISIPDDQELTDASVLVYTIGRPHMAGIPIVIEPTNEGILQLHAHLATPIGNTLRYEPQAHKNTLGFWVEETDYPEWVFKVGEPGKYRVEILQGCGKGQGGSLAEIRIGEQPLNFKVEDTGHFQNFERRNIGTVLLDSSEEQTLQVHILQMAKKAAMDIRLIELIPAGR